MSSSPDKPFQTYSFTDFSRYYPDRQQPGDELDGQFDNIIESLTQTIDRLNLIQRDDGHLANESVYRETLHPSLWDELLEDANPKNPVVARTLNQTNLSTERSIQGIVTNKSRVLVAFQTNPAQNGIYITDPGPWTRATDADSWSELHNAVVLSTSDATVWRANIPHEGSLGTDPIPFVQVAMNQTYQAGAGLALDGNVFSVGDENLQGLMTLGKTLHGVPQKLADGTWTYDAHAHEIEDVTGLEEILDGKATKGGVSVWAEDFREEGFTDQQTIQAFFAYLTTVGGTGVTTDIGRPYDLTDKLEFLVQADFTWDHRADFLWASTNVNSPRGIRFNVTHRPDTVDPDTGAVTAYGEPYNIPLLIATGGRLRTAAYNAGTALYVDNSLNISPINIKNKKYSTRHASASKNRIEGFFIAGSKTSADSGFNEAVVVNCVALLFLKDIYADGCFGSHALGATLNVGISKWGVAAIWRNYVPRAISNIEILTADDAVTGAKIGDVRITWNAGPIFDVDAGQLSVYLDDIGGDLGQWLNGRTFLTLYHDDTARQLVLRSFDATGLPPYVAGSGGIIEQSPSSAGFHATNLKVNWARIAIYASGYEGYWFEDCKTIGAPFSFLIENQLGCSFVGFNHANSTFRNLQFRGLSGIDFAGGAGLAFTRSPSGQAQLPIVEKSTAPGEPTTGKFTRVPWFFYTNCWVIFVERKTEANLMIRNHLAGNYYKVKNLNRVSKTFRLVDPITGADIDSSDWAEPWTSGYMFIVGEHIRIEDCVNYKISGWQMNATNDATWGDMRNRGVIVHNCPSAGPNLIDNMGMASGGTYSLVEYTGDTNYVFVGDNNMVFPGTVNKLIWDNSTSGTHNGYLYRRNIRGNTFTKGDPGAVPPVPPSTNFIGLGLTQTYGGGFPVTRYDFPGTIVFTSANNFGSGKQHAWLNSTDPAGPGAGLAIFQHSVSVTQAKFKTADRMPRFLLPGDIIDTIYDDVGTCWRPVNNPKFSSVFDWYDDFIIPNGSMEIAINGTGAVSSDTFQTDHFVRKAVGVARVSTGPTATGGAAVGLWSNSIRLGTGCAFFMARVMLDVLSDVTDAYKVTVGFHDGAAVNADVTDGVYWEYDASISTKWQMCCAKNGVVTRVDGFAASSTVSRTLGVFVNGDGSRADFFYSGDNWTWNFMGSITTNIPAAPLSTDTTFVGWGTRIRKTAGTIIRSMFVDWQGVAIRHLRGTSVVEALDSLDLDLPTVRPELPEEQNFFPRRETLDG